jgi:hypothetical protein
LNKQWANLFGIKTIAEPHIASALQQQVSQFVAAQQSNGHATAQQAVAGDVLENLRALGYIE